MYYNFNPMFAFKNQVEKTVTQNPKFKEFCEQNKGKSVEQICQDYNIDYNTIKKILNIDYSKI